LLSAIRYEIDDSTWFEDGQFRNAIDPVEAFVSRMESTEDVIFSTVNSLSIETRDVAEQLASYLVQTLAPRFVIRGLPSNPAYTAHNVILRDLFGYDIVSESITTLRVADDIVTQGLMNFAALRFTDNVDERALQTLVIALTLAAGWLESPERRTLSQTLD
jgi:hypothetical protein